MLHSKKCDSCLHTYTYLLSVKNLAGSENNHSTEDRTRIKIFWNEILLTFWAKKCLAAQSRWSISRSSLELLKARYNLSWSRGKGRDDVSNLTRKKMILPSDMCLPVRQTSVVSNPVQFFWAQVATCPLEIFARECHHRQVVLSEPSKDRKRSVRTADSILYVHRTFIHLYTLSHHTNKIQKWGRLRITSLSHPLKRNDDPP